MMNNQKQWEVQTKFHYGWENCWHNDFDGNLETFDTIEDAQQELKEYLLDMEYEHKHGNISVSYDKNDYRIVEVIS